MAETKFSPFTQLSLANKDYLLKVRFLSTWKRASNNNPNETFSLDFVCMDEEGNKMSGSCLAVWFAMFDRFLFDQNVVTIRKPMFGSNSGSWTVTPHPLKLCFNRSTEVANCADWNGSRHGFDFVDFETILDLKASTTTSIDIIGAMVYCSPIKVGVNKKNEEVVRVNTTFQNLNGKRIFVTLFGKYAYKASEYVNANKHEHHFITILQFAKFENWKGRHSVNNGFDASNLFINDHEIEETTSFLHSFVQQLQDQSSSSFSHGCSSLTYNIHDDFLNVTKFIKNAEVEGIDKPQAVIVIGTIRVVNNHWYYMGCNHCTKKVESSLQPLQLTEGESGPPAEKENPFQLPPEIEYFIDKKYAFKFLNSALIEVEDATGATSSQKNVHKVVSISDDNITPVSNALKAVNEMEHSEGLKRNLDQVYDNEEVADVSSSKSRSSGSEKEATVTVKMLVPKKEK
ncbi:hypothetical protein SSX86_033013 [Deinandra increscens subsp. villosa]|uniref:Replication protein A 70 kDa DNA-binding subunit B/D first OB fold domain-containing protein n=1 Tax=Deinandra increscens subsp. villosa TaxID=3103831 RepID=A0AAP0C6I1_9ASTR